MRRLLILFVLLTGCQRYNDSGLPVINGYCYGRCPKVYVNGQEEPAEYLKIKCRDKAGNDYEAVESITREEYMRVTGRNVDEDGNLIK